MLRFLLSGTPGKTLLAHTSVCADTPLVCVQIKHTTHRCKEEKRRYEAGLKQKVLSGSTSNRIPFIFATGGNVEKPNGKKLNVCAGLVDGIVPAAFYCLLFPSFRNRHRGNCICSISDRDGAAAFLLSKRRRRDESAAKPPEV